MMKQIIQISTREKVTIKCKYCNFKLSETADSPIPSDNLMERMKQHSLMKHSHKYWIDWVKTND